MKYRILIEYISLWLDQPNFVLVNGAWKYFYGCFTSSLVKLVLRSWWYTLWRIWMTFKLFFIFQRISIDVDQFIESFTARPSSQQSFPVAIFSLTVRLEILDRNEHIPPYYSKSLLHRQWNYVYHHSSLTRCVIWYPAQRPWLEMCIVKMRSRADAVDRQGTSMFPQYPNCTIILLLSGNSSLGYNCSLIQAAFQFEASPLHLGLPVFLDRAYSENAYSQVYEVSNMVKRQ